MIPDFLFQAEENLVEKPWGGRFIAELKGVEGDRIGESWEFSAHPSRPSKVDVDGVLDMIELVRKFREEIIDGFEEFPILVKIIDANEDLSVQVHPSEEMAKLLGEKDHGKPEAWVVIDAEEDAKIYLGFREDVSPEELRRAVEEGYVLSLLNEVKVGRGDAFYIPAGTIHALGKGVRVLEVSTNSNVTYRIYDYGRGRELHLEKALKVLNFSKTNVEDLRQRERRLNGLVRLIDTEFFRVDRIAENVRIENEAFGILLCLKGTVRLNGRFEVRRGKSVLVPAKTKEFEVEVDDAEAYLITPVV